MDELESNKLPNPPFIDRRLDGKRAELPKFPVKKQCISEVDGKVGNQQPFHHGGEISQHSPRSAAGIVSVRRCHFGGLWWRKTVVQAIPPKGVLVVCKIQNGGQKAMRLCGPRPRRGGWYPPFSRARRGNRSAAEMEGLEKSSHPSLKWYPPFFLPLADTIRDSLSASLNVTTH